MLYLIILYAGLGSDQWAVREFAERELVRLVTGRPWSYGRPLAGWAAGATSPEVAFRVSRPLGVWDNWRANGYTPGSVPVWPVCDCYPAAVGLGVDVRDRQSVPPAACGPGRSDERGPLWYRWRRGTELMARRMIRDGRTPADVDALLLRMWRLELACGSDCGGRAVLESWAGRPWNGGYPNE